MVSKKNLDLILKEIFIKVFEDNEIDFSSCEESLYEKWDSLRGINLLLEVEKQLNLKISNEELLNFNSFKNIKNLIEEKLND